MTTLIGLVAIESSLVALGCYFLFPAEGRLDPSTWTTELF
jgi:hypothetical protein